MTTESEQAAINRSLENILSDPKFVGSPQMSAFLRYVVTETLQGNADRIKAYTVAVDALGKSEAFDPQTDPSVRVLAKRLRTSLDQYYERTSNHEKVIEMKAGSYKPIFTDPPISTGTTDTAREEPAVAKGMTDELSRIRTGISHGQSTGIPNEEANSTHSLIQSEATESITSKVGIDRTTLAATVNARNSDSIAEPGSVQDASPAVSTPKVQSSAESEHRPEQQAQRPVIHTSVNAPNNNDSSKSSNSPWYSKVIRSAQQNKLMSGALLCMTLGTLVWSLGSSLHSPVNSNLASATTKDNFKLQLASASSNEFTRQRPDIPTVTVRALNSDDNISKSLLSSISNVLSKFDHLQVLSPNRKYEILKKWPEDYEIVVDTLVMDDSKKISVKLISAESGRIAFSDDLLLDGNETISISRDNVADLELFVARIIQKNGPLLSDYKNQGNHSEIMACVFSIEAGAFESRQDENCLDNISIQGRSELVQMRLRAEISLRRLAKSDGSDRKIAAKNALNAAQKILDQAPRSADAHALMMQVFQLSGDRKTALKYGNNAKYINGLDGGNLLALAVLLEEMNKSKEADEIRKQVSYLNPSIFHQSL